uniref:Uncharacterized protein n=1 Tax=Strongyloides papillosus TaxID=174720 RepID=A0A0N5B7N6_STREA
MTNNIHYYQNDKSLTPLGTDLESVALAVGLFMMGGALIFSCCFLVTHCYLCYKRKKLAKKMHDRADRQNDMEYTTLSMEEEDISDSEGSTKELQKDPNA